MARKLKNIAQGKPDRRKSNGRHLIGKDGVGASTRFTKGHQPANTSLRKKLEKAGFTREAVNETLAELLTSTRKQTNEVKMDEETSNLELIGVSIIEAAVRNADGARLDGLLDKIFGKPVQVVKTENTNVNVNVESEVTETDKQRVERVIAERATKSKAKHSD